MNSSENRGIHKFTDIFHSNFGEINDMSDFISSFFTRFKLFSEASADVLPNNPPEPSPSTSYQIAEADINELDYYVRSFDPNEENGSDGYGDWKSENIKLYCNFIANNFRSNKFLCPLSNPLQKNKNPQTCIKKVDGEKPKVEYLNDWNFAEEDYSQLSAEWMQLGRLDRAAQAACFAINENKEETHYYEQLSIALFLTLNAINVKEIAPDAIEVSQAEIYFDPQNPNAHYRLAQLEKKTADQLTSKTDLKTLNTRNELYWKAINSFQTAIGFSNSRKEAAEFYYQAGETWLAKANVLRDLHRPASEIDQAMTNASIDFSASLENHFDEKTSFALGETLQSIEETKEESGTVSLAEAKKAEWTIIADYYNNAIKTDKAGFQNLENILTLVEALKNAERFSEARDWLKRLIKKDRHNPELLFELASMEEKLGHRRSARVAYYQARRNLIRHGENENNEMMEEIKRGLSRTERAAWLFGRPPQRAVS